MQPSQELQKEQEKVERERMRATKNKESLGKRSAEERVDPQVQA